jgi:hypothetical protein
MDNEATNENQSPADAIEALRQRLLDGLTPLDDFAAAMDRHPKTVKRWNPPIVYIGRRAYVPDKEGRAWILNGCKPVLPERHARSRGRARGPRRA